MTQPPNSYSLRKKFLNGLLPEIISKMIERGASPDLASLSKMVKMVKWIEDNKNLSEYYIASSTRTLSTEVQH